jgi:hypothetical protein
LQLRKNSRAQLHFGLISNTLTVSKHEIAELRIFSDHARMVTFRFDHPSMHQQEIEKLHKMVIVTVLDCN